VSEEIGGVGISVDGGRDQMRAYLRLDCGGSGDSEEKMKAWPLRVSYVQ
jgi:hypothetical protein